mmetsp:Transcript_25233/g.49634  ORF Transcript_25233/g.49634 Transcript_25233/m.49634 type:complete len:169 (-) Transcript_25233:110-616(-)
METRELAIAAIKRLYHRGEGAFYRLLDGLRISELVKMKRYATDFARQARVDAVGDQELLVALAHHITLIKNIVPHKRGSVKDIKVSTRQLEIDAQNRASALMDTSLPFREDASQSQEQGGANTGGTLTGTFSEFSVNPRFSVGSDGSSSSSNQAEKRVFSLNILDDHF